MGIMDVFLIGEWVKKICKKIDIRGDNFIEWIIMFFFKCSF